MEERRMEERKTHPPIKALYGYEVTNNLYANCKTPDKIKNSRKESISLSLGGISA
jgi:hypothetical protein